MQQDLFEKRKEPTVTKHELLDKYLRAWATVIRKKFPNSYAWYVDAFAGEGRYESGEKGSPLIAATILRRVMKEGKTNCRFHIICVEKNRSRARKLKECRAELRDAISFDVREGSFLTHLPWVLNRVGSDPAFFLLDPSGFAGMPLRAINDILSLPHKEVLINFMWNAIRRWSGIPDLHSTVTELMGTDAWRGSQTERQWLDLYVRQLRNVGSYVWAFRNKFPDKERTFYCLVYATKVLVAFKIMKDVMFRQDTRRNFEPDLFERIEFADFVEKLEKRIHEAGRVPRRELLEFTLCHTQYLDKHLSKALKELQQAASIAEEGPAQSRFYRFLGRTQNCDGAASVEETSMASYGSSSPALAAPPLRRPKIVYANYRFLNGANRRLVRQVADGSIVKRFDRTPVPKEDRDVVCPHFLELKWAYGCPYDCAWCYLKGTLRFAPGGTRPTVKNLEKVRKHTIAFLGSDSESEILNTGEIADSLMYEGGRHSFVSLILPLFEVQEKHKILFLTKSVRIESLLAAPSHNQAIVSFSLNANRVSEKWELRAPSVADRIRAASQLSRQGYEVRIRIDPLVPVEGWSDAYSRLLGDIFANFTPARITLGSLRGLQSTINNSQDKSWVQYLSDTSRWGRRVDLGLRCEVFAALIEALREQYDYHEIGLCKETLSVWEALRMDFRSIKCNCIL